MNSEQAAEIQRSLGRIEGKMEGLEERFDSLETLYPRVTALEGWRKWILGFQAAIGAGFVFIMKAL